MSTRKHALTINLDPYPTKLNVDFANKVSYEGQVCEGYTLLTPSSIDVKITRRNDPTCVGSTIAHELVHVVQFVENIVGNRFDMETEAYLVGSLYTKLFSHYIGMQIQKVSKALAEANGKKCARRKVRTRK